MALEDVLEQIKEQEKKNCLWTHSKKTDEELRAIIVHNALAIQHQEGAVAFRTAGESEACSELLKQRKEKQARDEAEQLAIADAIHNWEKTEFVRKRRLEAALSLPTATSHYGQLVAAILEEEDGLIAEEIQQWSNELNSMEEKVFKKLLKSLTKEGIITVDREKKYRLLTTCDKTLMPADPMRWANNKYKYQYNDDLSYTQKTFLAVLASNKTPYTEYDWLEITGDNYELEGAKRRRNFRSYTISDLAELVERGVLAATPVSGTHCHLYYFPMLGEGE